MNQIHDLLGSIIIGGIVLLMLVAFNGNIMESAGTQTFRAIVQKNLTSVTEILEFDMRKMGFRVQAGGSDTTICYADSNRIRFRGDLDTTNGAGTVDMVEYYVDNAGAGATSNPNDKVLHRKFNNAAPVNMYLGLINFKIYYYGANGAPITATPVTAATLSTIKSVKLVVGIESKDRIFDNRRGQRIGNPFNDTTYAGAYWERTFKPQNTR
ncbi:MAG TPA: hypothetical protein VL633_00575 [Bacteroidota bacterium]|jgi:hypothetical protein|nr:hypothetical protein [Bacteroidota bacterium]